MKKIGTLCIRVIITTLMLVETVSAAEKVFFYYADPAGTPLAMTDTNGTVIWRADYKPFGEEQSVTQTPENVMKFVGKEKDKETGLYYFGARYMKAEIGRFTSPDPVGPVDPMTSKTNYSVLVNPQKLNRYAYSLNNPYKYLDINGAWAEDVHSGIGNTKYGTYLWAKQVGFSDKDAKIIARGDNATDKNAGWAVILGVPGRHFNTSLSGSVDTREIFSEKDFHLAVSLYSEGKHEEALTVLGRGLHGLQDITAHGDWPFFLRHPEWFDSAEKRPEEIQQTGSVTKEYLGRFRNLIEKRENE